VSGSPKVKDQRTALIAGAVCLTAGVFLIYDAYDARGAKRPVWLHFLPGM
jgi:hypothetical protein